MDIMDALGAIHNAVYDPTNPNNLNNQVAGKDPQGLPLYKDAKGTQTYNPEASPSFWTRLLQPDVASQINSDNQAFQMAPRKAELERAVGRMTQGEDADTMKDFWPQGMDRDAVITAAHGMPTVQNFGEMSRGVADWKNNLPAISSMADKLAAQNKGWTEYGRQLAGIPQNTGNVERTQQQVYLGSQAPLEQSTAANEIARQKGVVPLNNLWEKYRAQGGIMNQPLENQIGTNEAIGRLNTSAAEANVSPLISDSIAKKAMILNHNLSGGQGLDTSLFRVPVTSTGVGVPELNPRGVNQNVLNMTAASKGIGTIGPKTATLSTGRAVTAPPLGWKPDVQPTLGSQAVQPSDWRNSVNPQDILQQIYSKEFKQLQDEASGAGVSKSHWNTGIGERVFDKDQAQEQAMHALRLQSVLGNGPTFPQ